MEVAELVAGQPQGGGRVRLLDVHMERVEVEPHMIGAGLLDEVEPLRGGVEDVALEAVDDLEHEVDAGVLGDVGGLGDRRDRVLAARSVGIAPYFVWAE